MNVLWLSTWVMAGSTVVIGLEEALLGHEDQVAGVNWPHLVQRGLTWTYLALLGASVALAAGWFGGSTSRGWPRGWCRCGAGRRRGRWPNW